MVNIDDSLGKGIDKLGGKNLHVAGKHNKIHSIFLEQRDNLAFGGELVVLFNGNKKERNPVELSNGATLRMIRDDAGNIAGQFSALMAIEKIDKAMIVSRDQNRHARSHI